MLLKANKALNDRRAGLKREEGFTLIELLVVVIIIGILAAIAIPIYIGVQNSSKDSGVKTDLGNIKIALVAWSTDNPTATAYPTTILGDGTLDDYGATASGFGGTPAFDNTGLTYPDFCVEAEKESTAGDYFHVVSGGGVEDGACN